MRFDFEQAEAIVLKGFGRSMGKPASKRGLSGSGLTDQQDCTVQRKDGAFDLRSAPRSASLRVCSSPIVRLFEFGRGCGDGIGARRRATRGDLTLAG